MVGFRRWSGRANGKYRDGEHSVLFGGGTRRIRATLTRFTANVLLQENPEDCIGGQDCNIRPTSVAPYPGVIDVPQTAEETPNKEYWIVTEFDLRSSIVVVNFSGPAMKDKLAILYTIAFTRYHVTNAPYTCTEYTAVVRALNIFDGE